MDKVFYNSQTVLLDDSTYLNGNFILDYYILITDLSYGLGRFKKIYGIEIVKNYIDRQGNKITQSADVKSITFNEKEIYEFAKKLFNATVTPISLKEIAQDYINERDCNENDEIDRGA